MHIYTALKISIVLSHLIQIDLFKCLSILKLYYHILNLSQSLIWFGDQESNVPCELCGKLVKNKYILKQHVKLVHEKKIGAFHPSLFVSISVIIQVRSLLFNR